MLTHVVLMTFTDPTDAPAAKAKLEAIASDIPAIRSMVVGLDVLGTDVSWHLCMTTTHDDADGLRSYQTHEAHLDLATWLRPRLAARAVVDYV